MFSTSAISTFQKRTLFFRVVAMCTALFPLWLSQSAAAQDTGSQGAFPFRAMR